jgi:glutathionyl-hydroquinone reductase
MEVFLGVQKLQTDEELKHSAQIGYAVKIKPFILLVSLTCQIARRNALVRRVNILKRPESFVIQVSVKKKAIPASGHGGLKG